MAKKLTPEGLRKAAEEMENAAKVASAAAAAKKTADNASKEAQKADAKAKAAVGAIGVVSGGNNNLPPQSGSSSSLNPEGSNNNNNKKCCWCSWVALVVALLALIFGTVLWFTKASDSSVGEVNKKAGFAQETAISADKKADKSLINSASANNKADEALVASANKCDVSVCCKEAEKPICDNKVKAPKRAKAKPKKPVAPRATSVVTPPAVVTVVIPEPVAAPCCTTAPHLNITSNSPRTDGRCVVAINDGGATKYIRLDQEKGSSRLMAFQVQNSTGDINRNLPITYVGFIDGSEKKTVELTGKPSCAASVKAFSEDRVFKWTAPRLHLGDKCKVVGRV